LALSLDNALLNQGGEIVTDAGLTLKSASLDNRNLGSISAKQAVTVETGAFDNSQAGQLSSGTDLNLIAKQLTNQDGGRIASSGALTASVTGLDQQGGKLFSNASLSLDLNQGQLNNQNGLINAPLLMLKNLKGVNNGGGEISSVQAFTLAAQDLSNDNGKVLSNQALTLRIDHALTNLKGLIAAAALDVEATSLDNSAGTLTSRANLDLSVSGPLINQSQGLINAADALTISTSDLNNRQGSLLGSAIAIDFGAATGNLNNSAGLITTAGILSLKNLRDLDNQGGEISSSQNLDLTARDLNNSAGKLISNGLLTVKARDVINQVGLVSGFKGIDLTAASLDNRNAGTLSSRDEDVSVTLSGALLNSADGALASKKKLTVTAASLDNRGGILSSGTDQTLTVTGGVLNNAQGGLIDSGAALVMTAMALGNVGGTVNAQQALTFTGTALDNTGGNLSGNAAVTFDLLGALTNTNGKLASAGPLRVERATQVDNQGGQIASQGLLTLLIGGLDNRNRGTVAANDALILTTAGAVQNSADGLIYSQNGAVQIDADSLANGKGTVQSQGNLTLVVDQDIDNQSGRLQAKAGDLSVEARHLDNRGGVLASLQGLLKTDLTGVLRNGYDLNNNRQGGITQAQRLNLIALGGLDNYGGRISAQTGDAVITSGNIDNRNGGLYAKGKVNVTANNFDNSGDNDGQIAGSQIDLNLTGALNNRLGIIESDSTLAIKAASLDNQTGQIRALGTDGKTQFQIGGLFDNRSGVLESANTDLSLGVGNLLNAGGSILHVGSGNFGIATNNVVNAGGSFVTRGALTLNADSWTNTSVLQAGTLNVNVNNFTQTATGQLLATTAFVGSGVNWRNDGLLASDGTLVLTLGGTYSGSGRMTSLGNLTAGAGQLELADAASIAGGATTVINVGGQLTNYGQLSSANDLSVTAAGVSNYGAIAASRDLTVTTQALLNAQAADGSRGLLFSGRNMGLRTTSFTNRYADVYSLGNLLVSGVASGTSAQNVLNSSASIEAGGDIGIAADNVVNQRDKFSMAQQITSGYMTIWCVQHCDGPDSPRVRGPVFIYNTVESVVSEDSPTATLVAGHNLTVNSTDFRNQYSVVSAANDLSITSTNITNQAALSASGTSGHEVGAGTWITGEYFYRLIDEVRDYDRKHPRSGPFDPVAFNELVGKFDPSLFYGINDPIAVQADGQSVAAAIIQAGGTAKLTASNDISSVVVQNTSASVSGRSTNTNVYSATQPSVVLLNRQLPPDLSQQQVNPVSLPGFSLPSGQNGLFRLSGQGGSTSAASGPQNWSLGNASLSPAQRQQALPVGQVRDLALGSTTQPSASNMDVAIDTDTAGGRTTDLTVNRVQGLPTRTVTANPHKYLVETNPLLTDLKQFMSSDYLLQNLGYDPDESAKRLGDGFYEQKLIQEAVIARTGQRFIDGQTSNEDMFKYLMNNAIASKTELDLSLGVSLTSEQVAALTHDIVWMENVEVNGEQVLTPVLYLANANNRLSPNGALIQGNNLNLVAGKNLENVGTLKATSNLSASAGENLVNSGLMQAGERLDLLAGNNVINRAGGIITGRDVSVTALMGDVVNERTVTSSQIAYGQVQDRKDFADSAARIEAANDLSLSAGGNINNIGGALQSGRDIRLNAANDVNIVAAQTVDNLIRDVNRNSSTITQYGASVTAGRDVSAVAGRDLNVVASQIDAKRDVGMSATENVNISSAADEEHFLYKSKKLTIQEDHVQQVKAEITAGGNVAVDAGKNLTMVSSRIAAGDEAYLVAGGKLGLLAAQDSDYSLYDEKKKGSWGSKKTQRDEVTDVKNIGSEITTGGDLTLVSGEDQHYQVAKLNSGNDLTLQSGGSITFESAKDLHQESHEKSKSSAAWFSMKGNGRTDETLRQSELTAQGDLVISAVGKIHADVLQVNKQTVSESIDAMAKADPKLAWLKELDEQGGIDWRQVQEVHTSFKYANSGMGPAAQMIVAILMTVLLGPAGAGLSGATLAGAASLATTGAVATINNKGDLGAGLKAVASKDGLTNAAIATITAGVADKYLGDMTMTKQVNGKTVIDLGSIEAVSHFAGQQLINNASAAAIAKAFGRDVTLAGILQSTVYSTLSAYSFDQVGNLQLKTGSPEKIALHALVGGMIAEASGSDFAVGAMAAGVNETFANQLRRLSAQMNPEYRDHLMLMSSQLLGVVAAAAVAGDDANSLQTGSFVAGNATQYNNLNHSDMSDFVGDMNACGSNETCQKNTWIGGQYEKTSNEITDWSEKAVSGAFAKSLLTSIQGGLTALKDLNCTTVTCTQYKDTLTERALNDLTNLAKVTDQWENATSLAALVIPGSGGARGAGEGRLSPRVQAALDKFTEAKAVRTGASTSKNGSTPLGGPDVEAGMPYNHPVKDTPRGATSDTQGIVGNGSKSGTGGSTGSGAGEKIEEFIPPGMDRPFRPVNPEYPPNQSVVDAMESTKIRNMVGCDGTDCSGIAIKLFDAAGGKGKVIEVRPSQAGNLNLYENGAKESGQFYHQVYTDGRYVYDPRLSSRPVPKGDWEKHIKGMNPDGVTISDKLKGLR
jgi:filamentous hemagglutinin